MQELSLHILDIAKNSVRANATLISITLTEDDEWITFEITDDGKGMSREMLETVKNPFTTTRTTRKVGLGIPLLNLSATQTGGNVEITSSTGENHGTTLRATFCKTHIDCVPLGDMVETLCTLLQGDPHIDLVFTHLKKGKTVSLSTPDIKAVLGEDVSLAHPEILMWIKQSLQEEYQNLD